MRKFFIAIPMMIIVGFMATGCSQQSVSKEKEVSKSSVLSQSSDKSVKEVVYEMDDILIKYPQIELKDNKEKSKKINTIIKDDISNIKKHYTSDSKDFTLEVNYEIKLLNDNMISILYKGYYNNSNNAYPTSFACTTNIDLEKESKIRLKDYEDVDIVTQVLLSDDKYELKTKDKNLAKVQKDYIKQKDEAWIKDSLLKADFSNNNGEFIYPEVFSYRDKNSLTLIIPIQHALGDYMEITIK